MEEIKTGKAIVRIHNEPNLERIKPATEQFLKKVQRRQKKSNTAKNLQPSNAS